MQVFCERIKQLRESRGATIKQVAEAVGVMPNTYSKYENGSRNVTVDVLQKLCLYFDVTSDYLIGLTDNPYAPGECGDEDKELLAMLKTYFLNKRP